MGHLDAFYGTFLSNKKKFDILWSVYKMIMIVSHEQSSREGEFSVNNKEIQQENLKNKTFSERLIYDNLNADSIEVYEFLITPALKKLWS